MEEHREDDVIVLEQEARIKPEFTGENPMMTAAHTTVLSSHNQKKIKANTLHVPGAGINIEWQGHGNNGCVHPDSRADMKKVDVYHGSPNFEKLLTKSPTVVNGRVEMFGEMSDMIRYWEEKEGREDRPSELSGGRRSSKRISELCEVYEGERIRDQNIPETSGGGWGRRNCLFTAESERGTKESIQMSKPDITISRDFELIVDTQFSAYGTEVLKTESESNSEMVGDFHADNGIGHIGKVTTCL